MLNEKIISLLKVLVLTFTVFIFIILLFDRIIMPFYIHHNREVVLPDVIHKNYTEAKEILESKKFKLIIEDRKPDGAYPPNVVLIQNPKPNSIVRKGRRVYVTLSTILNPISVPGIIGKSEREAKLKISNVGLKVGNIERDFSSFYAEGVVVNQSPLSGTQVRESESVDITVSLGNFPDEVYVPDVLDKNFEVGKEEIKKEGLKIRKIYKYIKNDLLPNTILGIAYYDEDISPGTPLKPGDSIDIIISEIDTTLVNDSLRVLF